MAEKRTDDKGRKLPDGYSQRPDGRYQARFTYEGKRYCLYDKNLSELKKRVNQQRVDLQNNNFHQLDKITLNSWFEKWLETYKANKLKPLTHSNYCSYWKWYVSETLGTIQLSKIKRIHIVKLYNDYLNRSGKPLSYGTIQYIHNLLYCSLEQAFQNDMITKNPCSGVLKELKKPSKTTRTALSEEQQQAFFSFLKESKHYKIYEPLFTVMFGTGMRVGEVLCLTWKDIDYIGNTVSVNKTLHYGNTHGQYGFSITELKTKNSCLLQ